MGNNVSDVIVIGGGLTGHIAAYELCKAGKKVSMLMCGHGASPRVSGFNIPCVEKEDSVEKFIEDTVVSGRNQADEELVKILCEGTTKLESYLKDIGFEFDYLEDGSLKARKSLGSSYARVVGHGNGSGGQILNIIKHKLAEMENFTLYENTRALRLIKDDEKVQGAYCYQIKEQKLIKLYAKAVLLCGGGFAGIFPFTSNTRDISGDAAAMALQVGCPLVDMEFVQFEPSSAVWPLEIRGKGMITTLFYEGAIMTNGKGERFMLKYGPQAECVNKDVLAQCIEKEILAGNATEHGGVYFDASGVDTARLHDAYQPFIDRYDAVGIDLTKEPVELANAAHTSLGGVKIDNACHSNLKGLYVAGESAGHVHGANRIGGSAGSETMVFGKVASESILNELDNLDVKEIKFNIEFGNEKTLTSEELDAIKNRYKDILQKSVSVYRNEKQLTQGYNELVDLYAKVKESSISDKAENIYKKLSLENDLLVAQCWVLAAKSRKDSCGCHQRSDYENGPKTNYYTEIMMLNNTISVKNIQNN